MYTLCLFYKLNLLSRTISSRDLYDCPRLVTITVRPMPIDADLSWSFYNSLQLVIRLVVQQVPTSLQLLYDYLWLVTIGLQLVPITWLKHINIECGHATVTLLKDCKQMTSHFYVYILHLHLIKMVGKNDKKEKYIKKGKANRKGGIVNQQAEISEHSDIEEEQEGPRRTARRNPPEITPMNQ